MKKQTKSILLWGWLLFAPPFALIGIFATFFFRLSANIHRVYQIGWGEYGWLFFLLLLSWSALVPVFILAKIIPLKRWVYWLIILIWILPTIATVLFLFILLFR